MADEKDSSNFKISRYRFDLTGPRLGRVLLLARNAEGFAPLPPGLLEERLACAFDRHFECSALRPILEKISRFLNDGEIGKAGLLTRLMPLPPCTDVDEIDILLNTIAEAEYLNSITNLPPEDAQPEALRAFVEAAKMHAEGCELDDAAIQTQACEAIRRATDAIKVKYGGVDLLLPLLHHSDPDVRLNACLQLIDDHYASVIPVLQVIDVNGEAKCWAGAGIVLQMYGEPNLANKFTRVEPSKKPPPGR